MGKIIALLIFTIFNISCGVYLVIKDIKEEDKYWKGVYLPIYLLFFIAAGISLFFLFIK